MSSELEMSSEAALAVTIAMTLKDRTKKYLDLVGESDKDEDYTTGVAPRYLVWMCDQIIENAASWPVTKLHRWVGYVQGSLVAHGLSNLETEKSIVREAKKTCPEG